MGLSGWDLFSRHGSPPEGPFSFSVPGRDTSQGFFDNGEAAGGRAGPLTVRQRFLLGEKVDLNRAGYEEISDLPGISDAVAKAIVSHRERLGGFRRPEDLLAVRGIKEKRLKKILPFISLFPNN